MAYKCDICGKSAQSGNNVSHSKRRTRTKWLPNLQTVRANVKGSVKKIKVCSSCIRSGKVEKAPRRNYQPESSAAK